MMRMPMKMIIYNGKKMNWFGKRIMILQNQKKLNLEKSRNGCQANMSLN